LKTRLNFQFGFVRLGWSLGECFKIYARDFPAIVRLDEIRQITRLQLDKLQNENIILKIRFWVAAAESIILILDRQTINPKSSQNALILGLVTMPSLSLVMSWCIS